MTNAHLSAFWDPHKDTAYPPISPTPYASLWYFDLGKQIRVVQVSSKLSLMGAGFRKGVVFRAPESSEGNSLTHAGHLMRAGMTGRACTAERACGFTRMQDPAYQLPDLKNKRKLSKSVSVTQSFYLEQQKRKKDEWPSLLFW